MESKLAICPACGQSQKQPSHVEPLACERCAPTTRQAMLVERETRAKPLACVEAFYDRGPSGILLLVDADGNYYTAMRD